MNQFIHVGFGNIVNTDKVIAVVSPESAPVKRMVQTAKETGTAVDEVSAALILADKTDVRRNRVQNTNAASFDIHDRVNYAALSSKLIIHKEKGMIQMELELDDSICTVMDYFEIFLKRMIMCRRAAERLKCKFKLVANGSKLC